MNHNRFQRQTDKGWQSMSELLEKELPQKRRRRFGWWFIGLLLMPFAAGAGWLMLQLDKESVKTIRANNNPSTKPVATVATAPSDIHPAEIPAFTVTSSPAHIPPVESTSPAFTAVFPDFQLLENQPPTSQLPSPEEAAFPEPSGPSESNFEPLQDLTLLPTAFQPLENRFNLPATWPLAVIKPVAPSAPPRKAPSPRKWHVGLTMGLASERFTAANSALVGLTVDWQPLRHWGVRSGLMYEYYKPSGIARPIAEVDAMDYADATRNHSFLFRSGVYVPGTSEALGLDVALPVTLIHRLRAPLLAYWKPVRWLSLYGGTSFCYTLRAQTSNKGLAFDNELVASRSPTSAAKVNKLATSELPRFQTQLQTGLGVHIGKRWEVGLAYQQAAKIQFKSLFDKRKEDGIYNLSTQTNHRPNYHFFTLSGILYF